MATEAQRLIGISLTKIAQSRSHRGGVSLHKNLLVATVLQKARYIFMEEAYHMVHTGSYCPPPVAHVPQSAQSTTTTTTSSSSHASYAEEQLVALTAEEAGLGAPQLDSIESTVESTLQDFLQPATCVRCGDDQQQTQPRDKENVPPPCYQQHQQLGAGAELTYLDLDKGGHREREPAACLKRRRAVAEWEIEEAVLSILPKRGRLEDEPSGVDASLSVDDDSVFLDEAALFSDSVAREVAAERGRDHGHEDAASSAAGSAMEIDRITSLVSIFSFGSLAAGAGPGAAAADGLGKLARSVSTPDLCSAQAKETVDALQQRPFIAMTV